MAWRKFASHRNEECVCCLSFVVALALKLMQVVACGFFFNFIALSPKLGTSGWSISCYKNSSLHVQRQDLLLERGTPLYVVTYTQVDESCYSYLDLCMDHIKPSKQQRNIVQLCTTPIETLTAATFPSCLLSRYPGQPEPSIIKIDKITCLNSKPWMLSQHSIYQKL